MNRKQSMRMPRALAGRRTGPALATFGMLGLLAACSPETILGNAKLPPELIDPAGLENSQGALAAYRSASDLLREGLNGHVADAGLLTDELASSAVGIGVGVNTSGVELIDSRHAYVVDTKNSVGYNSLNKTRGQVRQALGMLREFASQSSPALQGHLYAIDGYAKVMLAEVYCSGIPLSELVYKGDYRLEGPSTTAQVLERALASFDTAVAISADSARFLAFARVGAGRALLGLGRLSEAAEAVAGVPTSYVYQVHYPTDQKSNFFKMPGTVWTYNMSDREGINGLPFRSSGDPRTRFAQVGSHTSGGPLYQPVRYNKQGTSPIVLASGIEARLIEAEAALAADGSWLPMLNALRTDGTFTTRPNAANPAVTDTLWNAGTGGVAGLAPLADPGTPAARVDLLFRERAYWLHLTGHRLGDLRRLVRQYDRDPDTVFPIGSYLAALGTYGRSVSLRVPETEITFNPLYRGCLSEEA